jgi:stage IV sporulation protein FB
METTPYDPMKAGYSKHISTGKDRFDFPPKYEKLEKPANIWLRSFFSLALYLVLGYYIFHSFEFLLLITAIIMFHELGHFLAMKYYRYGELGIFFIPLLGAYVSGTKREVSQKESAVILLAGPLPGIFLGIILYMLYQKNPGLSVAGISFYYVSLLLILLNVLNLIPVYPLDGGQLLNRVFLEDESVWSKVFVILSAAFLCWVAWKLNFWLLLIFPALILMRLFSDKKLDAVEKKIEEAGINADVSYTDLPDGDYWKMRSILITEHPAFSNIEPGPPYEYHPKEEKIMATIQSLLHRHLIRDVPVAGKLFILLIWVAAFAAPWLLQMDMSFFRRFEL